MDENLTQYIDRRLDEERPDRYDIEDKTWMDPVIAEVVALIPAASARQIAAADKVGSRETAATRNANRLLREVSDSHQEPLSWMDMRRRPISWGKERVCLEECTSPDLRDWAAHERRRAANDFAARNSSCEGAEWIADEIDGAGARRAGDLW